MYFGDEIRSKLGANKLSGDRCVCGASAVVTGKDGYCPYCGEKRLQFADQIIGDIDLTDLHRIAGFYSNELDTIENFRRVMLRREIYSLVDMHFISYNAHNNNFIEPYDDPSFLGVIHEKKYGVTQEILSVLESCYIQSPSGPYGILEKRLNNALGQYKEELVMQLEKDSENISALVNYAFSGTEIDGNKVLSLVRECKRMPVKKELF